MILGSSLYLMAKKMRNNEALKLILMLNSAFLFLFVFFSQPIMVVAIIMLISMSIMLAFYLFRDDYMIHAGKDTRLVEAHAAFSSVARDLICSVSPVVLVCIFTNFSLSVAFFIIFIFQAILCAIYLFFISRKVTVYAIE